jgi:L-alanine-DL-glutamate epimerase-like enolase superfamily enzyme
MEFQLQHRTVKGTPVVSLNTVTRVVHILLLARQIHNARTLPTAAALSLLAFTALSRPHRNPALLQPHRSLLDDGDDDVVTGVRTSSRPT